MITGLSPYKTVGTGEKAQWSYIQRLVIPSGEPDTTLGENNWKSRGLKYIYTAVAAARWKKQMNKMEWHIHST